MQRISEYKLNASICAMQASAAPEPFKAFYQALELQWQCLAAQAKRESVREEVVIPKGRELAPSCEA